MLRRGCSEIVRSQVTRVVRRLVGRRYCDVNNSSGMPVTGASRITPRYASMDAHMDAEFFIDMATNFKRHLRESERDYLI